ncbi:MAG TPA: OsmC family protein [Coriobacteriia bacterium]|nr:OsmC family protein [Coriobacteriia bacterium]
MDVVNARWVKNRQFVGWDSKNHGIVMDTPAEGTGEGTGWRPVELLLLGLGGCTAIDVVSILEKKREDIRDIEVEVRGEPFLDDFPHYYETIEVVYKVTGVSVKPESVARAIELSEERYCSVKGSLGPQVNVVTSFEVIEFEPRIGPKR